MHGLGRPTTFSYGKKKIIIIIITRTASSYERVPSLPAQVGLHAPRTLAKSAPKNDGLRASARRQANELHFSLCVLVVRLCLMDHETFKQIPFNKWPQAVFSCFPWLPNAPMIGLILWQVHNVYSNRCRAVWILNSIWKYLQFTKKGTPYYLPC